MDPSFWRFEFPHASLQLKDFRARLDVEQAEEGMRDISLRDVPLSDASLLRLSMQPTIDDRQSMDARIKSCSAYVRGSDLIASYVGMNDLPITWTVYWRIEPPISTIPSLAIVSLIVSVETLLLDSHPVVEVSSQLSTREMLFARYDDLRRGRPPVEIKPSSRFLTEDSGCILNRLAAGDFTYVEMPHPADFQRLQLSPQRVPCWRLLGEFLEKGVVRRARLLGVFLPREDDIAMAAACLEYLSQAELPLTA